MLKILQTLDAIVAEVKFLQAFERLEIFNFSDAVRLQRKDSEASQTVEILKVITLIKVTVTLRNQTSSFVILFLPNQSSSRLTKVSRFSICLV